MELTHSNSIPDSDLRLLLSLYSISRRTLYLNYMEDFKILVDWIWTENSVGVHSPSHKLHWFQQSYEVQRLAVILSCSESLVVSTLKEIHHVH